MVQSQPANTKSISQDRNPYMYKYNIRWQYDDSVYHNIRRYLNKVFIGLVKSGKGTWAGIMKSSYTYFAMIWVKW